MKGLIYPEFSRIIFNFLTSSDGKTQAPHFQWAGLGCDRVRKGCMSLAICSVHLKP